MHYCPRCAVEILDDTPACPLCGAVPESHYTSPGQAYPTGPDAPVTMVRDDPAVNRKLFATLTVCMGLPLLTVFFIDRLDERITWAPYAMIPLLCAWCYGGLLLHWTGHPIKLYAALVLVTFALMGGLDRCDGTWVWFPHLGLPIVGSLALLFAPLVVLWSYHLLGWINSVGWILLALTGWCLIIDMTIGRWHGEPTMPTWSLVVLICLLPVSMFILYLHHRISKRVDLAKWFHI